MANGRWGRVAWAWAAVLVWMAVIFMLSAQPSLPLPLPFPGFDKLAHAVTYAILALLAYRGVAGRVGQAFAITALYGVSDEIHQIFVPGRSADVNDWLADIAGAAIALVLVVIFTRHSANGGK